MVLPFSHVLPPPLTTFTAALPLITLKRVIILGSLVVFSPLVIFPFASSFFLQSATTSPFATLPFLLKVNEILDEGTLRRRPQPHPP